MPKKKKKCTKKLYLEKPEIEFNDFLDQFSVNSESSYIYKFYKRFSEICGIELHKTGL